MPTACQGPAAHTHPPLHQLLKVLRTKRTWSRELWAAPNQKETVGNTRSFFKISKTLHQESKSWKWNKKNQYQNMWMRICWIWGRNWRKEVNIKLLGAQERTYATECVTGTQDRSRNRQENGDNTGSCERIKGKTTHTEDGQRRSNMQLIGVPKGKTMQHWEATNIATVEANKTIKKAIPWKYTRTWICILKGPMGSW